jgi:formate dehydrogenase subunit gamma
MSKHHKIIALIIALVLLAVAGLSWREAPPEIRHDAVSGATPFSEEEGKTLGVRSEAQTRAESGETHYTQSRIRDAGVFQQVEGHAWRTLRNGPVTFFGGWVLVLLPMLLLAFYKLFGPLKLHDRPTGRMLQRFDAWERHVHWASAGTFVLLGLTGLIILFGKHVLIPVIGHAAFSWIAVFAKNLHNLVGPLFFVSVVLLFKRYVKENLWRKVDWQWVLGVHRIFLGGSHIPSYKFNAGEKAWFWGGVTLMGLVVSLSGFVLDFPNFDQGRHVMQAANLVHVIGALLFIAASLGHIYMGTIGADGALAAMKTGMVDETWAKEHHQLWYEEEKVKQGLGK